MKTLSKRAFCALILSGLFVLGLLFFLWEYCSNAKDWVTFPTNGHIYKNGVLNNAGKVLDADGIVLAETSQGKRIYNPDRNIRKATMHVVGDRAGSVATGVQKVFLAVLSGYNPVTGVGSGGFDLSLTIKSKACASVLSAFGNKNGAAGVYNYKTGELLLVVTSPSFDPDSPPKIDDTNADQYKGIFLNRFFSAKYTPGSVFKTVTAAAALDKIADIMSRSFNCTGSSVIDGERITCPKAHDKLTFGKALTVSCNTAFAEITRELGKLTMSQYAADAGFNTQFDIDGIMLGKSKYEVMDAGNADFAWSGIGQYTDLANPCHIMMIMGAIGNGGKPAIPYIVKDMGIPGAFRLNTGKTQLGEEMFSPATCEKLKTLLRNNVKNGYGDKLFGGLNVCAKSGTAEIGPGKAPHAWFAGFVADESYPLAFAVVVENGGSGSGVAAPIAAKALKSLTQG